MPQHDVVGEVYLHQRELGCRIAHIKITLLTTGGLGHGRFVNLALAFCSSLFRGFLANPRLADPKESRLQSRLVAVLLYSHPECVASVGIRVRSMALLEEPFVTR